MTRKRQIRNRTRKTRKDVIVLGYHAVCLLDVLGQKKKLASWRTLPADGKTTPEFRQAIEQTVETVRDFRNRFLRFFKQLEMRKIPRKIAALSPAQKAKDNRFKACHVHVERFSDTFVFSSQIANKHGDLLITPVYRVLGACCTAMLGSLADRTPVRGALTIGAGGLLEDDSFYGPALAEAHRMESKFAGLPRIIVSQSVLDFIAEGQRYSDEPEVGNIMSAMAKACRGLIRLDNDGLWFVDFLGEGVRELPGAKTSSTVVEAVGQAYEFVSEQAVSFSKAGDRELAERYDRLQKYIESRLHLWGIDNRRG